MWESICRYVFAATTIKPEEIMRAVLPENAQEAIMTTAQRLRKEGLEQGLERGLERGVVKGLKQAKREDALRMLEEGLDIEMIVRVTGLSREEVEEPRRR